ncbi:MAG: hypothetical protein M1830_004266 [Pleopsidium flavum]|nr:MAG: hypothetical protein M1830_004266 [Pleopsidium flavum]
MRGGKTLAERGVIPRLLSGIYRRSRKIEKDSIGVTKVEVSMSYYEIYNDRVFDLFGAPEKRTASGLQLRDNGGKTVVVGLTERPCESLKEFERLYDQANINRSTSATKLNAHSSRSHAILCVNVAIASGDETRVSTASAIDLAGSEDNRRTDNGKERLVESASINKSLFVLAQCVEAISKKQARIPYRESKMTRILSLGQNNGSTIMILNLAPVRSYHLDTLRSLNFANRTKKIEIREIENEPIFKGPPRALPTLTGPSIQRQPLRPLATLHNATVNAMNPPTKPGDKPTKAFCVYSDRAKARQPTTLTQSRRPEPANNTSPLKRGSDSFLSFSSRPTKTLRPSDPPQTIRPQPGISKASIEEMVEKKVEEILATRALHESSKPAVEANISEQVQRRLELLEQRIEGKEDGRAEGLTYLLMAKQHHVRGEDVSALKIYELAQPYFPDNEKLVGKIVGLREKIKSKREDSYANLAGQRPPPQPRIQSARLTLPETIRDVTKKSIDDPADDDNDDYLEPFNPANSSDYESEDGFHFKPKARKPLKQFQSRLNILHDTSSEEGQTPRTQQLLRIINTRNLAQIKLLKGVGAKKAEAIVNCLCEMDEEGMEGAMIETLGQLGRLKGVGAKTVENMRSGFVLEQ